ncbi:MAG TPA: hypothetical protein VER96_40460 [Polyangiaceae bacterium]|nr:hypothetical protein [Polyangiaceae bacterium]
MTTFKAQPITASGFKKIRTLLSGGIGFFSDGPYRYVVADSDVFRFDVVRRDKVITWSDTIKALPTAFKVVINGGYFSGSQVIYGLARTGVRDPADVTSNGEVKQAGAVVLPDNGKGSDFFFFGRNGATPPAYSAGQGNPPGSVNEGSGGLGPMILPNPGTGAPLKFGTGNVYASDPKKSSIPANPKEFADCVQRNNNRYAAMQVETGSPAGTGFGVVAVLPSDKLLIVVLKPHQTVGDLDTIRDALFSVGCTLACFTDGSTSACLAVNGSMEPGMAPAGFKDNLIETGFGLFLYKAAPPTKVSVTFTLVEVLDDATFFGSSKWTLTADVLGSSVTLLTTAEVNTGDKIVMGGGGFGTTVTVPSGAELAITSTGASDGGDDLGTATARFGSASAPAFGVGTHLLSTLYYRLTYVIAIVP